MLKLATIAAVALAAVTVPVLAQPLTGEERDQYCAAATKAVSAALLSPSSVKNETCVNAVRFDRSIIVTTTIEAQNIFGATTLGYFTVSLDADQTARDVQPMLDTSRLMLLRPIPPLPAPPLPPEKLAGSVWDGPVGAVAKFAYVVPPSTLYPESMRAAGIEGRTVVKALIGLSGSPIVVSVQRSSGYDALDQAALAAVRRSVLRRLDGKIELAWATVPIDFKLR